MADAPQISETAGRLIDNTSRPPATYMSQPTTRVGHTRA